MGAMQDRSYRVIIKATQQHKGFLSFNRRFHPSQLLQSTWKSFWFVLDSGVLMVFPHEAQESNLDSVIACYDLDQVIL